ncbi:MAG: HAD-IIB family hydrolase [Candidatus Dormibacteria bacterium]
MTPRLLISDLDGTLLGSDLRLDPRDVEAAHDAVRSGRWLGVASGRMYRSALPYALELRATLPLVCYQGALIQELPDADPDAGAHHRPRVLHRQDVPPGLSLEVLRLCRRHGYTLNVYQDDQLYVDEINDDVRFYTGIAQVEAEVARHPSLEQRLSRGSTKLTVVSARLDRFTQALDELRHQLRGRAVVTRSVVGFCEITAPGVDKGRALRWLCRHLGVDPGETVAVGDAPNDLPLLEAAGVKVAVESAAPELRAIADLVVPGPGGGGLAEVVRRLGLDQPDAG